MAQQVSGCRTHEGLERPDPAIPRGWFVLPFGFWQAKGGLGHLYFFQTACSSALGLGLLLLLELLWVGRQMGWEGSRPSGSHPPRRQRKVVGSRLIFGMGRFYPSESAVQGGAFGPAFQGFGSSKGQWARPCACGRLRPRVA